MSESSQSVKKLSYLARRDLAAILDHSSPRGADWKGLCDRMGFVYDTVRALRAKESPTLALLDEWESAKGNRWNQGSGFISVRSNSTVVLDPKSVSMMCYWQVNMLVLSLIQ